MFTTRDKQLENVVNMLNVELGDYLKHNTPYIKAYIYRIDSESKIYVFDYRMFDDRPIDTNDVSYRYDDNIFFRGDVISIGVNENNKNAVSLIENALIALPMEV